MVSSCRSVRVGQRPAIRRFGRPEPYAPVATSSAEGFRTAREAIVRAMNRNIDVGGVQVHYEDRAVRTGRYATALAPYVWPVSGIGDLKVAPFHLPADEAVCADAIDWWRA